MIETYGAVAAASFFLGGVFFYKLGTWRVRRKGKQRQKARLQREQSAQAHQEARERDPPVQIGETVTVGIKEFQQHHSGANVAVTKQEGFVIFVENCPEGVEVGDRIDAKITSFGKNETSAEAVFVQTR